MTIQIDVTNQKMRMTSNNKEIVAGTQEFVKFQFNFSTDWSSLTVFAQFIQNGTAYNKYLDSNYCCYLPAEIVSGNCNLLLYGTGSNTIATSNYLTLKVVNNGYIGNATSTQITQSLYQQLVNMVSGGTTAESMTSIVSRLEAAIALKADQEDLDDLEDEFTTLVNSAAFTAQVEEAVNDKVDELLEGGDLASMTIGDGTVSKAKLALGVQTSLDKADSVKTEVDNAHTVTIANTAQSFNNLRASLEGVYAGAQAYAAAQDTLLESSLETSIDNLQGNYDGSLEDLKDYVDEQDTAIGEDVTALETEVQGARSFTVRNTPHTYQTLGAAIAGAATIAEDYVDAALLSHEAFGIKIVNALPTGSDIETFTFYLIPKGNGKYDKWWRINNPTTVGGVTTDNWQWDNFGSTSTTVVSSLPQTGEADVDYILQTSDGCMYYKWINNAWKLVAGSLAITCATLPTTGNANADYYVGNATDGYTHYRYINNTWTVIGSNGSVVSTIAGLETSMTNTIGRVDALEGNQSTMSQSISGLNSSVQALQNAEGDAYDIEFDNTTRQLKLTKNDETQTTVTITGGGGGGSASSSTLEVTKVTTSPLIVTPDDTVNLVFSYSSTDGDSENVDGTYTWKKDGIVIKTGACVQGNNTFNATEYCVVGSQKFTLIVTDDAGSSTSKTWTVQKIDVRIESSFNDAITYPTGSPVTFTYTPYGAVSKTVHFILDGTELQSVTSAASGSLQSYSISAQTHGSHLLEVFITATVNSQAIETAHIYKDIMFYNEQSTTPVIGCALKNTYYHVVENPSDAYIDHYYVLDDEDGFVSAPYKTVTNPVASGLANYYKVVDGAYVSTADDANVYATGVTYYEKKITEGVTYYSHKIFFNQYDTNGIQYYVNSPTTSRPSVTWKVDGSTVSTQTLTQASDVWSYNSSTTGAHTLTITCGATTATIEVIIVPISISVTSVTAGLAFDFNPTGLSNSSASRLWSDATNSSVALTVSNNFDWSNGGYQTDSDGNTYFCVKAGTTATISHKLFETEPKTYGKEFKVIFKTTNVKDYSTPFLSCMDAKMVERYDETTDSVYDDTKTYYTKSDMVYTEFSGSAFVEGTTYYEYVSTVPRNVGFKMQPHAAYLFSSASSVSNQQTYLYAPYCEEDKIEFEWNINTINSDNYGASAVVMSYEDGVGLRPMIYEADHEFKHTTPTNITIGCADCDVHIYRMKAYNNALTDSNILANFIADAPNGAEMIARYNRNQIYDQNGNLTPEALAEACPDLKIIKIECPQFTNSKSTFVKYTNVQCIHKGGDQTLDNWTFTNCWHSGQGTTSNEYGYSGRNIDIICCADGVHQWSTKIAKTQEEVDTNYKTTLTLGDGSHYYNGTGKVSLSRTSVPNNWFNIKVNIASSENANNALLQKRYDTYLPYTPAADTRDSKIKNDMEFFNCVVFVKETGNANGTTVDRREFTDGEWHFYAIGNIGDSKKTDSTRVINPDDMREFVIEVSDNTLPNANFNTGVYCASPSTAGRTDKNGTATEGGEYYADADINYSGTGTMVYPITESQWNNASNAKRTNLAYAFDGDSKVYTSSFEFRYDLGGETRDGDSTGLTSAGQSAQRELNKTVFKDFYKWLITASNTEFVNNLSHWCVQSSLLYWYLFTERYTMIDNRTKNTFWHFGNIGEYSSVDTPVLADIGMYFEKNTTNGVCYNKTTDTAINSTKTYYVLSDGFRSVPNPNAALLGYYYEYDSTNERYVPTADTSLANGKTYYWTYAFEMYDYDNDTALGIRRY